MALSNCPICIGRVPEFTMSKHGGLGAIDCPNCGRYLASPEFASHGLSDWPPADRALISGWVREQWRRGETHIVLQTNTVGDILQRIPRLKPPEKAERLLLLFEELTPHLGAAVNPLKIKPPDAFAVNEEELASYTQWLRGKNLIRPTPSDYTLTMEGWSEAQRLRQQRQVTGNRAFMAMQFGDERLDLLVANHFVPAVKAAGFDLRRLDEGQPAGLIDDQLRVRIRTARFMVSDITHGNNGTYWEAGYAEGLGRPVIYSCEKTVFDSMDKNKRAHFDTNHLVTVLWEPDKFEHAARKLKDIVRATFPDEAKLED